MRLDNPLRVFARTWIRKVAYGVIGVIGFLFRPRRPIPNEQVKKILVIRLDLLGDLIFTMPLVEGLRRHYPSAHIEMLTLPYTAPLAGLYPSVDRVTALDTNQIRRPKTLFQRRTWDEYRRVARYVRSERFDVAVSVNGRMASLCAFLSRAKRSVGYAGDSYPYMLTDPLSDKRYLERKHEVEYVRALTRALGAEAPDHLFPPVIPPEVSVEAMLRAHSIESTDVVLAVHAGSINDVAKRWPVESWAKFAEELESRAGARVVLVGAGSDRAIAERVRAASSAMIASLVGQTDIPRLTALLNRANLVVSGDSGPLHLAVALARPVIGLYGPTDPVIYGPYKPRAPAIVHRAEDALMGTITVDEVVESALHLLTRN